MDMRRVQAEGDNSKMAERKRESVRTKDLTKELEPPEDQKKEGLGMTVETLAISSTR